MAVLRARTLSPTGPDEVAWCPDARVVIEGGVLREVSPWRGGPADEDLRAGVLLPGFVDAHLHYPQARIVGSASGPLLEWLARSTFPEEARFADPAHAAAVAELFCTRVASAGTTLAMVYGSVHPEACETLLSTLDRRGLRAIAGPVLMDSDCPDELKLPADRALPALEALAERWHGHDDRLHVAVMPRFALSCTEGMLSGAAELARARGLWVSTHLAENPEEVRVACERFGAPDYLTVYERAGLVFDRTVLAHCVHLSEREWERLADAGAVVAHCPDSNDFLGSGSMPIGRVLEHGIELAIGTDIAAGRSFRVPRILSSAYDNALRTGHPVDPVQLLWWGTRGGALALGQPQVGALEAGLEADMVLVDVPFWADTVDDVLAAVLFDHDGGHVRRTWVRGRVVFERA